VEGLALRRLSGLVGGLLGQLGAARLLGELSLAAAAPPERDSGMGTLFLMRAAGSPAAEPAEPRAARSVPRLQRKLPQLLGKLPEVQRKLPQLLGKLPEVQRKLP